MSIKLNIGAGQRPIAEAAAAYNIAARENWGGDCYLIPVQEGTVSHAS